MTKANQSPRFLTNDERKAAEAAFSGRPFNPKWSESARAVYEGLSRALPILPDDAILTRDLTTRNAEEPVATYALSQETSTSNVDVSAQSVEAAKLQTAAQASQLAAYRRHAIEAGLLIDVTTDAQKLGLSFAVTITKPLWEIGIAPSQALSDADKSERLRDILMAFRLRLAGQATLAPLIDFPAMLALPPGSVPQPVPLFALIQPDEQNRAMATLLLPNEISTSIIPMN